jgi:hypothetical protein
MTKLVLFTLFEFTGITCIYLGLIEERTDFSIALGIFLILVGFLLIK